MTNKLNDKKNSYIGIFSKESVVELFNLFENVPNYITAVDEKLRIISINHAFPGRKKEEIIGRKMMEFVDPSFQKIMADSIKHVFKTGKPHGHESSATDPNGKIIWYDNKLGPIKKNKKVVAVTVVANDITDKKRAIDEIKASEDKFKAIYEAISDGLLVVDLATNKFIFANSRICKLTGYTEKELLKMGIAKIHPKKDLAWILEGIKKQASGEIETLHRVPVMKKDKTIIYCDISSTATKMEGKNVVVGSFRDMTEKIKAEKQLIESDALKTRFITSLTHITRTPLTAIRWNLESLISGDFGSLEEEQKIFIHNALQEEEEILRLIDNMNTLMDIERKTLVIEKSKSSITGLISSVLGTFKNNCSSKEIKCNLTKPEIKIPSINIDCEKIRKVLELIIDNAIHYTPSLGSIVLNLSKTKTEMIIKIKDNGIGIPKAEQDQVFDRFFRASNANTQYVNGAGIGLYIAKAIIEEHSGKIGFESQEGKGSTFWIKLPIES